LFWKIKPFRARANIGDKAGYYSEVNVYWRVGYKNKDYQNHVIIWELHNGPVPEGYIVDHRNRNPIDNRIENLRLATVAQNNQNRRSNKNSKGVIFMPNYNKKKWRAAIKTNKKVKYLGAFLTKEEAQEAYNKEVIKQHGEFAVLGGVDGQD